MYLVERRVSSLGKVFAFLAILITVLGVFGLASYTAEQKTKEVGIRKVLGAGVKQMVGMFLWMFVKNFPGGCIYRYTRCLFRFLQMAPGFRLQNNHKPPGIYKQFTWLIDRRR